MHRLRVAWLFACGLARAVLDAYTKRYHYTAAVYYQRSTSRCVHYRVQWTHWHPQNVSWSGDNSYINTFAESGSSHTVSAHM